MDARKDTYSDALCQDDRCCWTLVASVGMVFLERDSMPGRSLLLDTCCVFGHGLHAVQHDACQDDLSCLTVEVCGHAVAPDVSDLAVGEKSELTFSTDHPSNLGKDDKRREIHTHLAVWIRHESSLQEEGGSIEQNSHRGRGFLRKTVESNHKWTRILLNSKWATAAYVKMRPSATDKLMLVVSLVLPARAAWLSCANRHYRRQMCSNFVNYGWNVIRVWS